MLQGGGDSGNAVSGGSVSERGGSAEARNREEV